MKYLLTIITFFISFMSFSQDINFGDGEFEVKTNIDAVYTDDGDTYKITSSGDAGDYGKVYLSYKFTSILYFYFPHLEAIGSYFLTNLINPALVCSSRGGIGCLQKSELMTPPSFIITFVALNPHCLFS